VYDSAQAQVAVNAAVAISSQNSTNFVASTSWSASFAPTAPTMPVATATPVAMAEFDMFVNEPTLVTNGIVAVHDGMAMDGYWKDTTVTPNLWQSHAPAALPSPSRASAAASVTSEMQIHNVSPMTYNNTWNSEAQSGRNQLTPDSTALFVNSPLDAENHRLRAMIEQLSRETQLLRSQNEALSAQNTRLDTDNQFLRSRLAQYSGGF
jgi:hypothetical protein